MTTPRTGIRLLEHMINQVEASGPGRKAVRVSLSLEIAIDVAAELESLGELGVEESLRSTAGVLRRRREQGRMPLQHGDRLLGLTVDQVFRGQPDVAWVST